MCLLPVQTFSPSLAWPLTICFCLIKRMRVPATSPLLPCVFLNHTYNYVYGDDQLHYRYCVRRSRYSRMDLATSGVLSILVCLFLSLFLYLSFLAFLRNSWTSYLTTQFHTAQSVSQSRNSPRFSRKLQQGVCVRRLAWMREACRTVLFIISLILPIVSTDCIASIFRVQAFQKCRWWWWYIYLLQLGCHPVAVVILHVNKTWNWLLLRFKSGGLHEKHVVATWNVGNRLSVCL